MASALLTKINFRTHTETDIRPFKGLLIGMFSFDCYSKKLNRCAGICSDVLRVICLIDLFFPKVAAS